MLKPEHIVINFSSSELYINFRTHVTDTKDETYIQIIEKTDGLMKFFAEMPLMVKINCR